MNMKYFAYCRVSSEREDKQVLSPESQKRELLNYAREHNLKIVKIFSERGTAYKTGRKEFNKMLEGLENGEANGILVFHLSRIARNSYDGGRVIYMMDEGTIKEIRTKEKTYINCSDDKFLMQIHFAMNKKSSDDNSTFVKKDIITKLEKQEFPGHAPIGYLNINKDGIIASKQYDHKKQEILQTLGRPLRRIEKDPIVAPLLRKVFDLALTGQYGLNPLREEAYKLGIVSKKNTKLAKNVMKKILTNPFYSGEFEYYEKIWKGNHEAILSKNEFERLQEIQGNRSRPKKTRREYVFSMLINCEECGHPLSSDHQKGHDYLRCSKAKGKNATCSNKKHYQQYEVGKQVVEKLKEVQIPKSIVEWALKQLEEAYEKETTCNTASQDKIRQNISILKKQITNLNQKWLSAENLSGDLISDAEYRSMKNDIQRQIQDYEESLKSLEGEEKNWFQKCEEFLEISRIIVAKYEDKESSVEEKRMLLEAIGSKFILTKKKLTVELNKPYYEVREANRKVQSIRTAKNSIIKGTSMPCTEEMIVWQARKESNPQLRFWRPTLYHLTTRLYYPYLYFSERLALVQI